MRTLQEQIEANKRASAFLVVALIVILVVLGTCLVGVFAPRYWMIGASGSAALAVTLALVATKSGSQIVLAVSGARPAKPIEDQVLRNVVEEMAIASGLPAPQIYVIDDLSPNAFATGPDPEHAAIIVTAGLLSKLTRKELQGVVAHEMGHIRNFDIRFMTRVGLIAGLIPLLADLFLRSQWFGFGGGRSRDRDDNNLSGIFFIVGIVFSILAPICAVLLELAVSRQREFLADATAAQLTRNPEGLAIALRKLSQDPVSMANINRATQHLYIVNPIHPLGKASSLWSTHPSTEERIKALNALMGRDPSLPPQHN